jgi:hypothetical protein
MLLWSMVGLGIAAHAYHLTTGKALRSRANAIRAFGMSFPPPPAPALAVPLVPPAAAPPRRV